MNVTAWQDIPGMEPARLRWRVDTEVLKVEFLGHRGTPEQMVGCWKAVQDLAIAHRLECILAVDLMDDEPLTGEQRNLFIRRLFEGGMAGRRWAYVARSVDRVKHYEATQLDALERGLDVQVFGSLSEAERWLRFSG